MLQKSKLQHELLNGRQFSFPFKFLIEVQLDRLKHSEAYFSSMTYQFLTWDFKLCNRSTVHPKIGYTCAEVYRESTTATSSSQRRSSGATAANLPLISRCQGRGTLAKPSLSLFACSGPAFPLPWTQDMAM